MSQELVPASQSPDTVHATLPSPAKAAYRHQLDGITLNLLRHADQDQVILGAAAVVQSYAESAQVDADFDAVRDGIIGQAAFTASYFDGTGRGRRETERFEPTVRRLLVFEGQERVASKAALSAVNGITHYIRRLQPGKLVMGQEAWGRTHIQPEFVDGPNTAYQVTVHDHGYQLGQTIALIRRPVQFENGKPIDNNRFPSGNLEDYSSDQVAEAHGSIIAAWQADGAADSFRMRLVSPEDLTDVGVIKLMHGAEQALDDAVARQQMPSSWFHGEAIAVLPHTKQLNAPAP